MIITINRDSDGKDPIVTIDTSTCKYHYSLRGAIMLALRIDGYEQSVIDEVFNNQYDVPKTEESVPKYKLYSFSVEDCYYALVFCDENINIIDCPFWFGDTVTNGEAVADLTHCIGETYYFKFRDEKMFNIGDMIYKIL